MSGAMDDPGYESSEADKITPYRLSDRDDSPPVSLFTPTMSPPVVEVVTLPIGEKLKADPSLIKTFAKRLFDQEGCKKVSYGPLVEDPNQALLFIGKFWLRDIDNYLRHMLQFGRTSKHIRNISLNPTTPHQLETN